MKIDFIDNIKRSLISLPVTLGNLEYICKAAIVAPELPYNVGRDLRHEFSAVIDVDAELVTFCRTNDIPIFSNNSSLFMSDVRTPQTLFD